VSIAKKWRLRAGRGAVRALPAASRTLREEHGQRSAGALSPNCSRHSQKHSTVGSVYESNESKVALSFALSSARTKRNSKEQKEIASNKKKEQNKEQLLTHST